MIYNECFKILLVLSLCLINGNCSRCNINNNNNNNNNNNIYDNNNNHNYNTHVNSSFGTEFVFVFPIFFGNDTDRENLSLYAAVTNRVEYINNVSFWLSTNNRMIGNMTLNKFESSKIEFDDDNLFAVSDNVTGTIYVNSTYPISLIGGVMFDTQGDSFLILPISAARCSYRLMTGLATSGTKSNFYVIIPLPNSPRDSISIPNCDGSKKLINISYPNTHLLACSEDLTGHLISSSEYPVVVMVGVNLDSDFKNFGTEMLVPVKYWGKTFFFTSFATASSMFRIVANKNDTKIYSNIPQGPKCLNAGGTALFSTSNYTIIQISASHGISVFQVRSMQSETSIFIQVPPVEQYFKWENFFAIMNSNNVENFAYILNYACRPSCIFLQGNSVDPKCQNLDFQVLYLFCLEEFASHNESCIRNLKFAHNANITQQIYSTSAYALIQYGQKDNVVTYGHVTALNFVKDDQSNCNQNENDFENSDECECLPQPSTTSFQATSALVTSVQTTTKKTTVLGTSKDLSTSVTYQVTTEQHDIHVIIQNLTNTVVNNSNEVSQVLNNLNDTLSLANGTLNADDLKNVAETLCHCSKVEDLSDENFYSYMDCYNQVMDQQVDEISLSQLQYNSSVTFLLCLQQMAMNLVNSSFDYNNTNVAMTISAANCSSEFLDLSVGIVQYLNGTINLFNESQGQPQFETPISVFGLLPYSAICMYHDNADQLIRSDFVIYRNQKFFTTLQTNFSSSADNLSQTEDSCQETQVPQTPYTITIDILSNNTDYSNLKQPVLYGVKMDSFTSMLHGKPVCAYWELNWYSKGCILNGIQDNVYICQCTHLTDFSLIVDSSSKDPTLCDSVLSTIGTIITSVSTVTLFIAILLSLTSKFQLIFNISLLKRLFQRDTKSKSIIGDTLLVALFLFYLFFILFADKDVLYLSEDECSAAGAALYTFLVSTLFYAGFTGITFFKVYYIVFEDRFLNFLTSERFTIIIATIFPILVTLILWFEIPHFFQRKDGFCWIRPDYIGLAVILPTTILLLGDIVVSICLIKGFFFSGSRAIQSAKGKRRIFIKKVLVLLMVQIILGFPWVIEYFTLGSPTVTVFHYLFTIANGSQGIWLTVIYMYSFVRSTCTKKQRKFKKQNTKDTLVGDSRRLGNRNLNKNGLSSPVVVSEEVSVMSKKNSNNWDIPSNEQKMKSSYHKRLTRVA